MNIHKVALLSFCLASASYSWQAQAYHHSSRVDCPSENNTPLMLQDAFLDGELFARKSNPIPHVINKATSNSRHTSLPIKRFASFLLTARQAAAFSPSCTRGRCSPIRKLSYGFPILVSEAHKRCTPSLVPLMSSRPLDIAKGFFGSATSSGIPQRCAKIVRAAVTANPLTSVVASFAFGLMIGCAATPALQSSLAIYRTAEDIPGRLFHEHATLTVRVIKVADGDTYRVAHVPLFSRFRRPANMRTKAEGGTGKLSESTMSIRIAAVDCPETAKFGNQGQRFGDEATMFAKQKLEGRVVRLKLLSRDQYQRAVSMVGYGWGPWQRDISEELLKNGLAVVYRQGGAQYDGSVQRWDKLEAAAKKKKIGVWSAKGGVDPAAYKRDLKKR